jgi:ParB family chromosome partitioning protein
MAEKRPALGRGLSALIPEGPQPRDMPVELDLDLLTPNRYQPRDEVEGPKLEDLARSIKSSGVIQPILVRPIAGGSFEIVVGERRWRAAQRAGLLRVPVVVRDVPNEKLLELALVENIQREDLNPIEEATAYKRLADEYHLTQDEIATAVGKDRSTVANYVRLLNLPTEVRADVAARSLSMGHARALLSLTDEAAQRRTAREVVARELSVRETEALVRTVGSETGVASRSATPLRTDVHTRAAEEKLRFALGARVRIVRKGKGGRIEIEFISEEELQRLYERLTERNGKL